jgi:signal transduction histidine kinase
MKAYRNVKNNPVIEVFDNGTGIQENIIDDIFVPFFTTKKDRSGIGLSLVKQLVFLNKAKLNIKSEQEKGTNITIVFA